MEASFSEVVDLCSDEEDSELDIKPAIHLEAADVKPIICSDLFLNNVKHEGLSKAKNNVPKVFETYVRREKPNDNGRENSARVAQSSPRTSDQSSVVDGSSPTSTSTLCSAPVCRQFWKAGYYDDDQASKTVFRNGKTHLRVHPKFLHSNATSHKWALGAIAEVLDNAIDEIQNGATFVIVDKFLNPRDGSAALLIRDDGGGMDPDCMRRCLSFGFSEKKSESSIGQYGNGFKTSTMRLGADVIVFSRCICGRKMTQSVGLLSYSFLRLTGRDDIVVPMVHYEFDPFTNTFRPAVHPIKEHFASNLSILLQWSPYATETDLLKQLDDIGHHGTNVIVYNLWLNDGGGMELDFESDQEDILINGGPKILESNSAQKMLNQTHIANRFRYSLRAYSSILYLGLPSSFRIILRGRVVEQHNIGRDLKFPEFILYRPQVGGNEEAAVITTIGFLKEAPNVNIHGFNVYHKSRLILPFWRVIHQSNSRGRGVVGVLEANFIQPTHDKQDFERTPLFQKLETRLKQMTLEYWDFHCGLIGYHQVKNSSPAAPVHTGGLKPVVVNSSTANDTLTPRAASMERFSTDVGGISSHFSAGRATVTALSAPNIQFPTTADAMVHGVHGNYKSGMPVNQGGFPAKRKLPSHIKEPDALKRPVAEAESLETTMKTELQGEASAHHLPHNVEAGALIHDHHSQQNVDSRVVQENKKLRSQCIEYEKEEEELQQRVKQLEMELQQVGRVYDLLLKKSMNRVKKEGLHPG